MATFVLSKYRPEDEIAPTDNEKPTPNEERSNKIEKILLKTDGSISEMVAKTLSELLKNKVNVTPLDDNEIDDTVKVVEGNVINTEMINSDPVGTFESIGKDEIVFISSEGFYTQKEEWFLMNLPNKTDKVFYTMESLARYCNEELDGDLKEAFDDGLEQSSSSASNEDHTQHPLFQTVTDFLDSVVKSPMSEVVMSDEDTQDSDDEESEVDDVE